MSSANKKKKLDSHISARGQAFVIIGIVILGAALLFYRRAAAAYIPISYGIPLIAAGLIIGALPLALAGRKLPFAFRLLAWLIIVALALPLFAIMLEGLVGR